MTRTVDEVFNDRTCYHFADKAIDEQLLREIYDVMKLGPTSANSSPLRIIFVGSAKEKDRLASCVMQGNVSKVKAAPITALFAYDTKFYDKIPYLFPHMPSMREYFSGSETTATFTANLNSALQAAYFMVVARAKGLACTPMSGFDMNAVNTTFLSDTNYKISFICCLGYRNADEEHPRSPRLSFEEACSII
jgi:3-hydroxypropanoate dehydrogenase